MQTAREKLARKIASTLSAKEAIALIIYLDNHMEMMREEIYKALYAKYPTQCKFIFKED